MLRLCVTKFKSQNILKNNVNKIMINNVLNAGGESSNCCDYSTSSAGTNKIHSFVDERNIVSSRHMDIDIFDGLHLHEFIWRNVDKWWDKTAVTCSVTGKSYTYEQLKRLSGRLAASFRKMNLGPGDTIAVVLPNMPEYVIIFLATSEAGLKLTLINPVYTAREINKQLDNSETAAVVTVPRRYPVVAESINGVKSIRHPVIIIQDESAPVPSEGTINFKDLVADGLPEFEKIGEKTALNPANDTVLLPYSSGTTGLPKGVELTHRNMVANLAQLNHKYYSFTEEAIGDYQDVTPLLLPMYHIYGFSTVVCDYLSHGGKLIIMPTFTSNGFLDVLSKNRVSHMFVAPPVLQLLANDERFTKKHIEGVKQIMSGGAPASEEVMAKIQSRLGNTLKFNQGYGMSEASPLITIGKDSPLGSVGRVVPNTRIRIVGQSDDGEINKNLPTGEIGEIQVSGPQIMKGYFKNRQATLDTMDGEWLKTGDLGSFSDDGHLTITGRLKELIKVKGSQVSPAELEDLIHGHKKVADVAVVGTPHERFGEIPKAFVVAKKGVRIEEDEIKEFVAEKVVDYKRLGQVVFVEEIPKNASGKILRRELQKM